MMRAANRAMGAALAAIALATLTPAAHASPATLPTIFPAPATMTLGDGTVTLGRAVTLIVAPGTEPETATLVRDLLTQAGVTDITTARRLPAALDRPTIVIGPDSATLVREALLRSNASLEEAREGYTLTSLASGSGGLITLAGHDADGLFHAAQTLRQLLTRETIPALTIRDHPAMPIRGTIEGSTASPGR